MKNSSKAPKGADPDNPQYKTAQFPVKVKKQQQLVALVVKKVSSQLSGAIFSASVASSIT
jgi:hypothetical protein